MNNVLPLRDWSSAMTRAETSTKRAVDCLSLNDFSQAIEHLLEAKKQLEFALMWIGQKGGVK